MTIDQKRSRTSKDAVPALLKELNASYGRQLVLAFERTAGDEVQCLTDNATAVVDIVVELMRSGQWSIGIGVGEAEEPLPDSVRAARGTAFIAARIAVDRAKSAPANIAVEGHDEEAARAESALWLLGSLLNRRTVAGWEAAEEMATAARSRTSLKGRAPTQAWAATRLGITPQAMNSRLHVAGWREEQRGRQLVAHLLEGAS